MVAVGGGGGGRPRQPRQPMGMFIQIELGASLMASPTWWWSFMIMITTVIAGFHSVRGAEEVAAGKSTNEEQDKRQWLGPRGGASLVCCPFRLLSAPD